MSKSYRHHLIIIGLYTLLTLVLTWPLAAHLTTHVPGEAAWAFDESTFLWNMWWLKFSILTLQQTPLESHYIFFPLGIKLTTYTFNLFNAAFGLPLQLTFSLPWASNLTLLFSFVSSAYGMFLLSLYLLRQDVVGSPTSESNFSFRADKAPTPPRGTHWADSARDARGGFALAQRGQGLLRPIHHYFPAFAAGAVFAFSASRMMYAALGHYNFVTIQWFPFYTLFLLKVLRVGNFKDILLAGLFAALCLYAELTFSVFLVFITVILLAGEWLRRGGKRAERRGEERSNRGMAAWPLCGIAPAIPVAGYSLAGKILAHPFIRLFLVGLIAFILTAPFVLSVLPNFLDPAYAEPGWGEGLKLSADLVGLVTLTPLHPLSGQDWLRELRAVIEGTGRFTDVNTLFLGYGILALALLGYAVCRKKGRVWLWSALIFTLLSLGPLLTINGRNHFDLDGLDVTFPMPFALLHYLPLINANRVPNRFGIPLTLALAVLVGYAVSWIMYQLSQFKIRRTLPNETSPAPLPLGGEARHLEVWHASRFRYRSLWLISALLLLSLLLFDQYSVPIPLSDARIPEVYNQIGAEPDDFTLMQLPLGWRNSYGTLGAEQTQLQYYQSAHHRPILGGNTSRNPAFKFEYYANIPLFAALTETELYRSVDESTLQRARLQAAELMTLYNIKYLVIHEPIPQRKPYEDTFVATRRLALDLIPHQPEPVYESPGVQAFAVQPAEIPNPLTLDFGDWRSDPYRGEGWAGNEEVFATTANWATANQAAIFFPVNGAGDRLLSIQIAPFSYPGMPEQTVSLSLNGNSLAHNSSLREGWQTIEVLLPETTLVAGLNHLTLHFAHTAQPRQVLPANRFIGQTGIETPIDLEVNSGSDFAFITVGFGSEAVDASAHRRGLNVAVIEPQSGRLITSKGFDTAANEFEARALSQFIQEIPAGRIVIVATQGLDAASFFDTETLTSLQSLGLTTDPLTPSFAAIGVKGASTGTALQARGDNHNNAYLRIGLSPDTRTLAAAVDRVTIARP